MKNIPGRILKKEVIIMKERLTALVLALAMVMSSAAFIYADEENPENTEPQQTEEQNVNKRSVKENPSAGKKAAKERKKVKKYTKKRVKAAAGKKKAADAKAPKKNDKA